MEYLMSYRLGCVQRVFNLIEILNYGYESKLHAYLSSKILSYVLRRYEVR